MNNKNTMHRTTSEPSLFCSCKVFNKIKIHHRRKHGSHHFLSPLNYTFTKFWLISYISNNNTYHSSQYLSLLMVEREQAERSKAGPDSTPLSPWSSAWPADRCGPPLVEAVTGSDQPGSPRGNFEAGSAHCTAALAWTQGNSEGGEEKYNQFQKVGMIKLAQGSITVFHHGYIQTLTSWD